MKSVDGNYQETFDAECSLDDKPTVRKKCNIDCVPTWFTSPWTQVGDDIITLFTCGAGKQYVLVCLPLGSMAKKQCFRVCPPSGSMDKKQYFLVCPP